MNCLLHLFKRKNKGNRRHEEFQKKFNEALRVNRKIVLDAKIVGDTLSVARAKVNPIIICPNEIDGVLLVHLEGNMSNRCNVVICGNVITNIVSFG